MPFPAKVLLVPSNAAPLFFYDWNALLGRMTYFAKEGPDFAIIELKDGNYVQWAGIRTRLTVETRVWNADRTFRHLVWGKGIATGVKEQVPCVDGPITVDASQILQIPDARVIIQAFIEGEPIPEGYISTDTTKNFAPLAPGVRLMDEAWDRPEQRRVLPPNKE